MAAQLFELAVEIKNELGISLDFINLSGGVGVDYTPANKQNDIAVIGEGVHTKFDEILVPNDLGDISIYTELGRFMTAPHGSPLLLRFSILRILIDVMLVLMLLQLTLSPSNVRCLPPHY